MTSGAEALPDSAQVRAQIDDLYDTYRADGPDRAMQNFMTHAGLGVPLPACSVVAPRE